LSGIFRISPLLSGENPEPSKKASWERSVLFKAKTKRKRKQEKAATEKKKRRKQL
jgi:hypothetical protein